MHYPAKHNIFAGGAFDKIVQKEADVLHDHPLRFLRNLKGMHVPAPVPVQKHAVIQLFLQNPAGGRFSDAHRPADQK
jgi:RIO-like serine/threonine protein kinase